MALLTLEEGKKKVINNFEITNYLKPNKMIHHNSKAQQKS